MTGLNFSKEEILEIAKAWLAISVAVAIILRHELGITSAIFVSMLTVGLSFVLHELGHKFVAQRYGFYARFHAFNDMLVFSLITSLFGFLFAVPGAVFVSGYADRQKNGRISAAGPLVNLLLAVLFLTLLMISGKTIFYYGLWFNSFFAFLNMLPFRSFDGMKVLAWNRKLYLLIAVPSMILMFVSFV